MLILHQISVLGWFLSGHVWLWAQIYRKFCSVRLQQVFCILNLIEKENYDSNIMPSSNSNDKELEAHVCERQAQIVFEETEALRGSGAAGPCFRWKICAHLTQGVGSGADLGEEQDWGKEAGANQPLAYHKCVLYCNIKHWLLLCFLLKQVIKGLLKGDSIPIFYIYPQRTCGEQIMVTNLPPPPPPSSPRSNKKKKRAGVNTGGVVNLFGNGFSGPAMLFLMFFGEDGDGMGMGMGLMGWGRGWGWD